ARGSIRIGKLIVPKMRHSQELRDRLWSSIS
ncbi:MAG: hypothetical protein ACI9TF_001826, partial [Paracrocinitomix sp.]